MERNWIIWELEIHAVSETLIKFRAFLQGMVCVIHTDHLNNVTMVTPMKPTSGPKILRKLVFINSFVKAIWEFTPGVLNRFGDAMSRNPPDRDAARQISEELEETPLSLAEAFKQANTVMRSSVAGDAGHWMTAGEQAALYSTIRRQPLHVQAPGLALDADAGGVTYQVNAVVGISLGLGECDEHDPPLRYGGGEVTLRVTELLYGEFGEGLEWYTAPEINKKNRGELQLRDGYLRICRALQRSEAEALVLYEEASYCWLLALDGNWRAKTYALRRAQDAHALEMVLVVGAPLQLFVVSRVDAVIVGPQAVAPRVLVPPVLVLRVDSLPVPVELLLVGVRRQPDVRVVGVAGPVLEVLERVRHVKPVRLP